MPIIFGNNNNAQQTKSAESEQSVRVPLTEQIKKHNQEEQANHHILIVDGKEKKVSKRSAYLLDMLVIDDE
jgi:hypothetical protein